MPGEYRRQNDRMTAVRSGYDGPRSMWEQEFAYDRRSDLSSSSYDILSLAGREKRSLEWSQPTMIRPAAVNTIRLHVYDLVSLESYGCLVEIGQCFNGVNSALHQLGTGAYHVGIEVNGVEFAYGSTRVANKTGVFSCYPMQAPNYQYRTTIDFGERPMAKRDPGDDNDAPHDEVASTTSDLRDYVDGQEIVRGMESEYMGIDYDILRKNCCTFACDACLRLGIPAAEIPAWFRNLAESGAMTQDVAYSALEPITTAVSMVEQALLLKVNLEKTRSAIAAPSSDVSSLYTHNFSWGN